MSPLVVISVCILVTVIVGVIVALVDRGPAESLRDEIRRENIKRLTDPSLYTRRLV